MNARTAVSDLLADSVPYLWSKYKPVALAYSKASKLMGNRIGQITQVAVPLWLLLRRDRTLKDGPESARAATVGVWLRWGFTLSPSARTGLEALVPRAKVVQTVVCSTFTPRGQARCRSVADGERMNARRKASRPPSSPHQGRPSVFQENARVHMSPPQPT
jgi:hypothetical protein